jgi:hypothetical protein
LSPLIVALSDREDARAAHCSIYPLIYLSMYLFFASKGTAKKNRGCSFFASVKNQKKKMPKKRPLGRFKSLACLA